MQFFQHTNSPNPIQLLGYPHWWNPPMILVAKWGTSLSSRVLFTRCYTSQKQRGEMREAYPKLRGIPWYSMGILIKRYNYPKSKWPPSEMMFFAKHTHTGRFGMPCIVSASIVHSWRMLTPLLLKSGCWSVQSIQLLKQPVRKRHLWCDANRCAYQAMKMEIPPTISYRKWENMGTSVDGEFDSSTHNSGETLGCK